MKWKKLKVRFFFNWENSEKKAKKTENFWEKLLRNLIKIIFTNFEKKFDRI